ncbi:MAG: hypothetical protein V7703_20695 [Hyphomicrobiales bacterium]
MLEGASGVFERGNRKTPEIDEEQVKDLHAKIGHCHINPVKPDKSLQFAIKPPLSRSTQRTLRCVFDGVCCENSDGVSN